MKPPHSENLQLKEVQAVVQQVLSPHETSVLPRWARVSVHYIRVWSPESRQES